MLQNSISQWRKKVAHPFHFDEVQSEKTPSAKTPRMVLVSTKSTANDHLPFSTDHQFDACVLPIKFEKCAESIREFSVRKDDVWILSFPKSGGNIVHNFVQRLKNVANSFESSDGAVLECDIFKENPRECIEKTLDLLCKSSIEKLNKTPSPRVIQSHLPPNLLPVELWTIQPKIIYIARNAKDVAVETFHALKSANQFDGTISDYFDVFLANKTCYAPFCAHVNNFWQMRHLTNFLFVNFDDLMAKQFQGIKQICSFLDCSPDDDELERFAEDLLVLFSHLLFYCGFNVFGSFFDRRKWFCFNETLLFASHSIGICLNFLLTWLFSRTHIV